jgi:lipoate-protein ligase A
VGGAKLLGSAQLRRGQVLLQHGSLLLDDDQARFSELGSDAPPTATLHGLLRRPVDWDELTSALRGGWEAEFGGECRAERITAAETSAAEGLLSRYRDPCWTWRA